MTHHTSSLTPLSGMRVAVFVADGVEDLEYWVSVMRLREAGVGGGSQGQCGQSSGKSRAAAETEQAGHGTSSSSQAKEAA